MKPCGPAGVAGYYNRIFQYPRCLPLSAQAAEQEGHDPGAGAGCVGRKGRLGHAAGDALIHSLAHGVSVVGGEGNIGEPGGSSCVGLIAHHVEGGAVGHGAIPDLRVSKREKPDLIEMRLHVQQQTGPGHEIHLQNVVRQRRDGGKIPSVQMCTLFHNLFYR